MESVALLVQRRAEAGKSATKRLRAQGRVPGIVYGKKGEAVNISLDALDLRRVLQHGHNVLLELSIEEPGGSTTKEYAVINEIQRDPLRPLILNVDFHHVELSDPIEARVPIELVGEAEGAKAGGILDQVVHEVDVRALPQKMPVSLPLDVSRLQVGGHMTAGALPPSPDYEILTDPGQMIVTLLPPRLGGATAAAEGEAEAPEAE